MPKPHHPTNPEEPIAREQRLVFLIDTLESLIDDNDTHVSGQAIGLMREAREELAAEHRLLQRGII